jgi:transmembrane sensor
MSKNYVGVEDFLLDDSFLSWYFEINPRHIRQWERWIADNPGRREQVDEANQWLNTLRMKEHAISPELITRAETRLLQKIHQFEKRKNARAIPISARFRWVAAASIILLLTVFYSFHWLLSGKRELRTGYGEIGNRQLPDGTELVVNADSRISYTTGWQDGMDREVWITGEAFFHVVRTPLGSRFIVHTDHFDIIVTGTRFNVVNREGRDNVMLKEGSVILHTEEGKELKMTPGDFVEYNAQLQKKMVRTDSLLAWKEYKLIFDNTPVKAIVGIIREQYGITVKLSDESVGERTISGILPNDNLYVLLQALEALQEFKVIRHGDNITIGIRS